MALATPPASLSEDQRTQICDLSSNLTDLGGILYGQNDLGCLARYEEALALIHRTGDRVGEAQIG